MREARLLIRLGVLLLLLGLLTGVVVPSLAVPRLGLSSHILGILGGLGSIVFGLVWPQLQLGPHASGFGAWLALYAFYVGWLMPLLGAAWGAGSTMLPITAGAARGSTLQEGVIAAGLITAAVAIVTACLLLLWGLRTHSRES